MSDDLAALYFAIRERFVGAVALLPDEQRHQVVPACPGWTVHQLLTHVVAMPMSLVAADLPQGPDPNPWLQRLVDDHSPRDFGDLAQWWASDDDALAPLVQTAPLLLADLFVHESDLHGAVASPGHRDAPELESQLWASVTAVANDLAGTELAPICVDTGERRLATGDGEPGWTLRVDAWEAHRALNSRRTRDELLALDGDGDATPYLDVLHAHLPLPEHSLGEAER